MGHFCNFFHSRLHPCTTSEFPSTRCPLTQLSVGDEMSINEKAKRVGKCQRKKIVGVDNRFSCYTYTWLNHWILVSAVQVVQFFSQTPLTYNKWHKKGKLHTKHTSNEYEHEHGHGHVTIARFIHTQHEGKKVLAKMKTFFFYKLKLTLVSRALLTETVDWRVNQLAKRAINWSIALTLVDTFAHWINFTGSG